MNSLPNGHIRLLHVQPGEGTQPISCELRQASLESAPSYEALSYTWGTTEQLCTIDCNDEPTAVTVNLNDALKSLRYNDRKRILWIDALCINQVDTSERTEQVRIMDKVYKGASKVIVWLGEEMESDKLAFDLIRRFEQEFKTLGYLFNFSFWNFFNGFPDPAAPDWKALLLFFNRPWFLRVWVIQEVALGRNADVMCGSLAAPWDLVRDVAVSLAQAGIIGTYDIVEFAPGLYATLVIRTIRIHGESGDIRLLKLLRLSSSHQATDAKDNVFALMNLASDVASTDLLIDYSMKVEEVFHAVAVQYLEVQKRVEYLSSAGMYYTCRDSTLPSWVADWSHCNSRRFLGVDRPFRFSAAGETRPKMSISSNGKILNVQGLLIGTITDVDRTHRAVIDSAQINSIVNNTEAYEAYGRMSKKREKQIMKIQDELVKDGFYIPEGQTAEEAFWRTICCDMTSHCERAPANSIKTLRWFRKYLDCVSDDGVLDPAVWSDEWFRQHATELMPFLQGANMFSIERNICILDEGYLGTVPHGSAVGDVICIFFGGTVPFVLRPDTDGFHRLVGECYVHGVMDGELTKREDLQNVTVNFKLR